MTGRIDYCVCCGEVVPEGRMVCPSCESMVKGIHGDDQDFAELFNLFPEDAKEDDPCTGDCLWDEDCSTCPYLDGCSVINGGGWG